MAGEYTTQVMREGLREFLRRNRPESLQTHPAVAADAAAASTGQPEIVEIARARPAKPVEQPITFHKHVEGLAAVVPPRPAGFCTGCPERPIFGADAGAGNAGPAPYFLRHRLPPVLDPAALQPGRHHHGLRPGRVQRRGLQRAGGQAPDLHHGRRRLLAQRPVLGHRQRRVQQVRRRHRHRRQLLRVGHRRPGHPVLARREPRPLHQQPHRPRRARRGRAMGAHAGSHLRRGQGARHHRGSAHHRRQGPQGHHRAVRVHAEQAAPHQAAVQQGGQGRQARGQGTLRRRPRRLHRRPRLYPAVRLPLADRQGQRRSAKGRPGRARGKQLRGLRQLR